jgi:hypothetical protein
MQVARAFLESIAPVQQEERERLGIVGEELEVHVRVRSRGPGKHGPHERWPELVEFPHHPHGHFPKTPNVGGLLLALVEALVVAKRRLDLGVVGKQVLVGEPGLASRLLLGAAVIGDAAFGHQPRSEVGDVQAQVLVAPRAGLAHLGVGL